MLSRGANLLATAILAFAMCGCAATSGDLAGTTSKTTCANVKTNNGRNVTDDKGAPHQDLINALLTGLVADPSAPAADGSSAAEDPFDKLLDCYVGPVKAADVEQRLLRSHIVVTMLAIYGRDTVNLRRYPAVDDARPTTLNHSTPAPPQPPPPTNPPQPPTVLLP